jgi:hypothetical protein
MQREGKECDKLVKTAKRWQLESKEEVKGMSEELNRMQGVGKKSGLIHHGLLSDKLWGKSSGVLNWDVFGSLSALIIFMVHITIQCL